MNIKSTLLVPTARDTPLPIFKTRIERGDEVVNVIAAVILGNVRERQISREAQECLDQFVAVQMTAYPKAVVHLVDLYSLELVDQKIEGALLKAKRGDAIAYLCKTPTIMKRTAFVLGLPMSAKLSN
jgi:hypothetical protein